MQSTSFRTLTIVVTVLLLGALALVLRLVAQHNAGPSSAVETATATFTQSAGSTATEVIASPTTDVARQRLPAGGFAFAPLSDFTISQTATSATLTGPGRGNGINPVFLLSGGAPNEFVAGSAEDLPALFDEFVTYFAEQDDFEAGEPQARQVDGEPALAADIVSRRQEDGFAGRIVMAQPQVDRLFVMVGVASATRWENEIEARYEALLDSVQLLDSATDAPADAAAPSAPDRADDQMTAMPVALPTPTPTSEPATSAARTTPSASSDAVSQATALPTPAPTRTPIPVDAPLPTPPPALADAPTAVILADANMVAQAAPAGENVWAATQGGIMAWNQSGSGAAWFTALDGLRINHFDAVVTCPLPGLGIVFGSPAGLQIFDTRTGRWNALNTGNSAMSFDDVSTLLCDVDNRYLLVGYHQHGLDIFDADSGEWTHLDRNDGLAADVVRHVAVVGNREAIWVSSGIGVSVLQGDEAQLYNAANSPLEVAPLQGMAAGPTGTVWIAGRDRLYRVDRGGAWSVYDGEALGESFPTASLAGVDTAQDGTVWLADEAGTVCRFDVAVERCAIVYADEPGMAPGPVTGVTAGTDGAVFYATQGGGVSGYDGTRWRRYVAPDAILAGNGVRSLVAERSGLLWTVTEAGVQQISPADATLTRAYDGDDAPPLNDVRVAAPAPISGLWLGGSNGAALLEDGNWRRFTTAEGLTDDRVQALVADRQRRMWIGTRAGLSIWNGDAFFNLTKENGLPSDNITALLATDDGVWIGTSNGGLYRFAQNRLFVYNAENAGLLSDTVTALAAATDGSILVGSERGLARFQDGRATAVSDIPPLPVRSLVAGPDGRIWVGTAGRGLYAFDGQAWRPITEGLPSLTVTALLLDRYATLWAGGESGGLARLVD